MQPSKLLSRMLCVPLLLSATFIFSQNETFTMKVLANRLSFPWEIAYDSTDKTIWTTERTAGKVTVVNTVTGSKTTLLTLGTKMVQSAGQDGLLGLAVHPRFHIDKPYVYIAYTYQSIDATHRLTKIERYAYTVGKGNKISLASPVTVIDNLPGSNDHNSGRLAIGPDNKLYYSIGDMGAGQYDNSLRTNNAQNLGIYEGKILRLNLEPVAGSWIPTDNPFTDLLGNPTAVYSYGHRNPQGLVWSNINGTNILYSCEHGPFSDDEVNLIERGRNYGWPLVGGFCDGNYNGRYLGGLLVTDEVSTCTLLNIKQPLFSMYAAATPPDSVSNNLTWPSVAPSGMDVYNSTAIPGWKSSLLIAGLKAGRMIRLQLSADGSSIAGDTIMYFLGKGRFRDVCISPDGKKIYLSTDNSGSTSGPTGGTTSTPANPGAILEFTYTGPAGPITRANPESESMRESISVYPNPAKNFIIVNSTNNSVKNYELISVAGVVLKKDNLQASTTKSILLSDIPSGVYVLKLYNDNRQVLDVRRISVVH